MQATADTAEAAETAQSTESGKESGKPAEIAGAAETAKAAEAPKTAKKWLQKLAKRVADACGRLALPCMPMAALKSELKAEMKTEVEFAVQAAVEVSLRPAVQAALAEARKPTADSNGAATWTDLCSQSAEQNNELEQKNLRDKAEDKLWLAGLLTLTRIEVLGWCCAGACCAGACCAGASRRCRNTSSTVLRIIWRRAWTNGSRCRTWSWSAALYLPRFPGLRLQSWLYVGSLASAVEKLADSEA